MTPTLVSSIETPFWQLSLSESGAVVTDLDYIKQQVLIALSTSKGDLAFDPEFGFNIADLLDRPVNWVIPNGKAGILDTLERDVPMVSVSRVEHTLDVSHVTFIVYCSTNLGNFTVDLPQEDGFAPVIGSPFSSGFGSGFA